MKTFFVKTYTNRNLVIKADFYLEPTEEHLYYSFKVGNTVVATVPAFTGPNGVFAVVEDEAFEADFYIFDVEYLGVDDNPPKPPAPPTKETVN